MIEQDLNKLILTFPTPDSATTFAAFLQSLLQASQVVLVPSSPPSGQLPVLAVDSLSPSPMETEDFLEPRRSRHTVLTEERQEQLFNQRQQGQTQRQRLLRAQTTLRDGVLPFSRPDQAAPQSTGQPSPRIKAQAEGGFADGLPEVGRKSRLKPVSPKT